MSERLMTMAALTLAMVIPPVQADEAQALHELLNRVERAWDTHDRQSLAEQYAEDGFLLILQPNEHDDPRVCGREQALSGIAEFWARSGVESHRFSERDLQPLGAIARLFLATTDTFPGGRRQTGRVMALARRGGGRWQMCFGMPPIVRPVVLVTEVLEGSQAGRIGLAPGDLIAEYAGRPVTSTTELIDRIKATQESVRLTIVRAGENRTLEAAPGTLGAKVEDRLLPAEGVESIPESQPHPVKEVLNRQLTACQAGDAGQFREILCPSGFLGWEQADSQRPVPVTLGNVDEHFRGNVEAMRRSWDLSSARIEQIRLAIRGGLALASYRFVGAPRQAGTTPAAPVRSLGVYVRDRDRWYLAASLPIKAELGLEITPEPSEPATLRRDEIVGVGIEIRDATDGLLIADVLPDSGAERAGLKADEIIVAIDGQSTKGMDISRAVELLRGPADSSVKLQARSASGQVRTVEVTRSVVKVPTIEHHIVRGRLGHLSIKAFGERTAADISDVLATWSQRGVAGIILDLRGNRGGMYPEVVKVADLFLAPDKTLWIVKDPQGRKNEVKSRVSAAISLPLVVIIDGQTRSGGELLASALKENTDTTLVGYPTAGEALLKERVSQPGGGSQIVERGQFLTAGGLPLSDRPVAPHVACPGGADSAAVLNQAERVLMNKLRGERQRR